MHSISEYQEVISSHFNSLVVAKEPKNLYEPIQYILSLGGKRMRPVLTLMAAEIFDCNYKKALQAATAVEVFHNFSLIHDDIMDDAPLRRGKVTVHEKWNINTGILSGDAMLILAYQYFENSNLSTDNFWNTALFLGAGYRTNNATIGIRYNVLHNDNNNIYTTAFMPFVRVYF